MVASSKEIPIPRQDFFPSSNGLVPVENKQVQQPIETYLPEVFAGVATEQPIDLDKVDPYASHVLLALWSGMSVQEIASAAETIPATILDTRTRAYEALLLGDQSGSSIDPENHYQPIKRAIKTRSIDVSGILNMNILKDLSTLESAELDEARRLGSGDDISLIPRGEVFDSKLFQRRLCRYRVDEVTGEASAPVVALHVAIIDEGRRISKEKAQLNALSSDYQTAA